MKKFEIEYQLAKNEIKALGYKIDRQQFALAWFHKGRDQMDSEEIENCPDE